MGSCSITPSGPSHWITVIIIRGAEGKLLSMFLLQLVHIKDKGSCKRKNNWSNANVTILDNFGKTRGA